MTQNHFLHFIQIIFLYSCCLGKCSSYKLENGMNVTSFAYSVQLKPYQWRYIRVDLPNWFSSMTIALESKVDLNLQKLEKLKKSRLPVICLRDGGPPLPDADNDISPIVFEPLTNASFGNVQGPEQQLCYPLQKNINMKLTNAQILPGVWYIGFFNGIGPTRTQAKMIERGRVYSFDANITIERCNSPTLGGPNCDQKINFLSCSDKKKNSISDRKMESAITCIGSEGTKCSTDIEPKIYAVYIQDITQELKIEVKNIELNPSEGYLKCYARYGAIPLMDLNEISANISEKPLIIRSPKIGWWYFSIHPVDDFHKKYRVWDGNTRRGCFSLDWQVSKCSQGKAGLNCASNIYVLQKIPGKELWTDFKPNYKPIFEELQSHSAEFELDPFFTDEKSNNAWTYFVLNVHPDDSGRNLHIQLKSNGSKIQYQVYARHMGLLSLDNWDYFYANSTKNSENSVFFKLYDSSEEVVSFYIMYVREGTWTIGLRRLNHFESVLKNQTMALISIEGCPRGCAPHGTCKSKYDISGSLQYSYCSCDEDHGGFDCNVTIISRQGRFLNEEVKQHAGHIRQSIFLIGSNAAALLPALWCLHQKAYAEWIVFMSSGIASGIYHACDTGNPCLLPHGVLQFMDFWLSFMAVGSTFIFLTNMGESSKGAVRVGVAIITALIARNGANKMSSIVILIAIGALGLLLGLIIELGIRYFSSNFHVDVLNRSQAVKSWVRKLIKTFTKRFRWGFLLAAFVSLAMAKLCWNLEIPENYWIWHSLWHVTIYTSSFLFLCSKTIPIEGE